MMKYSREEEHYTGAVVFVEFVDDETLEKNTSSSAAERHRRLTLSDYNISPTVLHRLQLENTLIRIQKVAIGEIRYFMLLS